MRSKALSSKPLRNTSLNSQSLGQEPFAKALFRKGPFGKFLFVASLSLVASACVGSQFRNSVGEFGELAEISAATQEANLKIIIREEEERVANQLATNNVALILAPECRMLLVNPDAVCEVKRRDGKPLERAAQFEHIIALGNALEEYGANLTLLSRDMSGDKAAFRDALSSAATSVAGLDNAVREAAKIEKDTQVQDRLGTIASIASSLGNLYFEHRRAQALKGLIRNADPVVQEASQLLQQAYAMDRLYKQTGMFRLLQQSQVEVRRLAANPNTPPSAMRGAQERLFRQVDDLNDAAKGADRFKSMGEAHSKLAVAASKGASKEDLFAAGSAIFEFAQSVGDALEKAKQRRN